MKKHTITVMALIAVLGMTTTGCQKDPLDNSMSLATAVTDETHCVTYTVDGVAYSATYYSMEDWRTFLDAMFALSEEGHSVSFRNTKGSVVAAAKEKVTFKTRNREEAINWADEMESKGYEVSIDYDQTTGIYTCTAIR